MAKSHNCSQCAYLKRTSPTQVFLLCEFWSGTIKRGLRIRKAYAFDYIITHCHLQPEAPACPYFEPRRVVA